MVERKCRQPHMGGCGTCGRKPTEGLGQFAWALFDWANSPFTTLIITFVFPAYFAGAVVGNELLGQSIWGYAIAASGLIIAVLSPPLGAIADAGGCRKPWILAFTMMCILGSSLLWFVPPHSDAATWAIFWMIVANLGFEFGVVFNNAMLPDIVPEERLGRLSGWAWGLGYLGGLTALAISLVVFVQPERPLLGLNRQEAEHVRVVGPLVAIWFAAFVWPLFVFTPDRPSSGLPINVTLRQGMRTVLRTLKTLPQQPSILRFLLAHMLYADGLATLFAFGGIYAAGTFGMGLSEVVAFGIVLNITAGIGAFSFAWLDDWLGSRRTAVLALAGLILASVAAVSVERRVWFWMAGSALGLFVGPVQAASRSFMARLSPDDQKTEFFGLFALSGKATAFAGPAMVAAATGIAGSQRIGLATVIGFFVAGLILLLTVKEPGRLPKEPVRAPDTHRPPAHQPEQRSI